jgi:HEAT repeat protein
VGLTLLAIGPLASFLPLFLRDDVGLPSGAVVWLQSGTMIGGMAASYAWGWAADRYGSKPVMVSGAYLLALQALLWWLIPRQSGLSLYVALAIAFLQGIATLGWQIGLGRLLFVGVVPPEKKTAYLALYYAWISVVEGTGQLLGGRLLDRFAGVSGQFLIFPLDSYAFLFLAAILLSLLNAILLRGVRAESEVGVTRFAGFFLRGNPLRAVQSLIRYQLARSERAAVSVTESLGQSRSPLAVEELLEALVDPRFYVRYEAIVSIARGGSDPRLTQALVQILRSGGPALSVIAAWALGRIGDLAALPALRDGLEAEYRSVQAHCARSLGSLGDRGAVPLLLERLRCETDEDLKVAFASALGALGAKESIPELQTMLCKSQNKDGRLELALALARQIGGESGFVNLWRGFRTDPATAGSQAAFSARRNIGRAFDDPGCLQALDDCAEALALGEMDTGAILLRHAIRLLPASVLTGTAVEILRDCVLRLDEFGAERPEYMLLAFHALQEGYTHEKPRAKR